MRTVLKIGGSILEPAPAPELLTSLVRRVAGGDRVVIVHGGGKALSGLLQRLGIATEFRNGLRVTDEATLQAALMVFAGDVNKRLVAALNAEAKRQGARFCAVGLTGIDGESITGRVRDPELGRVGEVTGGNPDLLRSLLEAGFTPVLAPLASDGEGGALNVNADQFASACARMIGASRAVFVTDVPGVLDANKQRIPTLNVDQLEELTRSGAIYGGMLPKLAACREALEAGVGEVQIIGPEAALQFDAWDTATCPGTRLLLSAQPAAVGTKSGGRS